MPPDERLTLYFARPIASVSVENLAVECLAGWLSKRLPAQSQTVSFTSDAYASSPDKKWLLHLPFIQTLNETTVKIKTVPIENLNSRHRLKEKPLLRILDVQLTPETCYGIEYQGKLPGAHLALRKKAGLNSGHDYEFENLVRTWVRKSKVKPPFVCAEKEGYLHKHFQSEGDFPNAHADPSWFYLPYLSLFMTGERALVATVLSDDPPRVRSWFLEALLMLRQATGMDPVILWIPSRSTRLKRNDNGEALKFTVIRPSVFSLDWQQQAGFPDDQSTFFDAADFFLHRLAQL